KIPLAVPQLLLVGTAAEGGDRWSLLYLPLREVEVLRGDGAAGSVDLDFEAGGDVAQRLIGEGDERVRRARDGDRRRGGNRRRCRIVVGRRRLAQGDGVIDRCAGILIDAKRDRAVLVLEQDRVPALDALLRRGDSRA